MRTPHLANKPGRCLRACSIASMQYTFVVTVRPVLFAFAMHWTHNRKSYLADFTILNG